MKRKCKANDKDTTKEDLKRDKAVRPKQIFTMEMPIPISVNHMYYNTKYGGKRLNAKAQKFFDEQRKRTYHAVHEQGWELEMGDVWFELHCDFYMPDKRIRDTHNTFKIMLDVLQGIVFKNDYFVKPHVDKVELDKESPRVVIKVFPEKST